MPDLALERALCASLCSFLCVTAKCFTMWKHYWFIRQSLERSELSCFQIGKITRRFISVCLLILGIAAHAEETVVKMGISFAIPPWVIQEQNAGIELDILRESLALNGVALEPHYVATQRAISLYEEGKLDGVINLHKGTVEGFYSDPVVTFQNVAVSLAEKSFPEDISIDFLSDKSVVAFQRASQLLGDEFGAMTTSNSRYQEVAQQRIQINLLMIRELDFIVLDKSIFGYYWYQATQDASLKQAYERLDRPVRFHYLFPPSHYPFVFNNEKLRDSFNSGLTRLKQTGAYDRIIQKYNHLTDLYQASELPEVE